LLQAWHSLQHSLRSLHVCSLPSAAAAADGSAGAGAAAGAGAGAAAGAAAAAAAARVKNAQGLGKQAEKGGKEGIDGVELLLVLETGDRAENQQAWEGEDRAIEKENVIVVSAATVCAGHCSQGVMVQAPQLHSGEYRLAFLSGHEMVVGRSVKDR
ncbi:hypothetical protein CLOM_g9503, partial [Closterium sp. NIES-68]